jgi:hypothetical protein
MSQVITELSIAPDFSLRFGCAYRFNSEKEVEKLIIENIE